MDAKAAILRGTHFGLHVDRGRKFETNFPVYIDSALRRGDDLRARTCLGGRRRWLRIDPFGRPAREVCCAGNLFAVQGTAPTRSSVAENAVAMGIDAHHMRWSALAQAIPPAYSQLLFGQAAMHEVHTRFGVPLITHDQMVARPEWAQNELRKWLRGAGAAPAAAGLGFEQLPAGAAWEAMAAREARLAAWAASEAEARPEGASAARVARGSTKAAWSGSDWSLSEVDFREAYYSRHGGYSQCVVGGEAECWLGSFVARPSVIGSARVEALAGRNTFFHTSLAELDSWEEAACRAVAESPGTRVSAVMPGGDTGDDARRRVERWRAAGFFVSRDLGERSVRIGRGASGMDAKPESRMVILSAGRRHAVASKLSMDRAQAAAFMDPIDAGRSKKEDADKKLERAWEPIQVHAERWRGKGLPEEVVRMMTEGVEVEGPEKAGFYEIEQYPFGDTEHAMKGGEEADRALYVGAMEYVPDELIDELLRDCIVHPWLVVHQGPDKWRACQDYKHGTNLFNESPPFDLPSAWSVAPILTKDTHFAKYDLRDGFWHVPIKKECRRRLLVRHPTNGRLMWATRLPFGYVRSPERFCLLTQSIADLFHRRYPGCGAHIFVFVDDYLVAGDDEEKTKWACSRLEEMFAEFGLIWAPHKRRGPARVMEFLGLLLCNVPGLRCMALTESREAKLMAMISEWTATRPSDGGELEVDPTELARLLGNLVFASQVVPGGRTAMMAMLASFKGLVVDWRQGRVKAKDGKWARMRIGADFWLDLEWWADHLQNRVCVPLLPEVAGEAVVGGTDASGWGYGNLIWIDGHREEASLRFTEAEQRRPINWRELLGILRVVQTWGGRLTGRTLLVETDNMTACWTAKTKRSRVADMQELIRRLVDTCEENDIQLRMTHTPGAKLHRPDQTSRGDAVSEPRQRLTSSRFGVIASSLGPFTSFIGSERWHAQPSSAADAGERMWVHPSFETVASALKLMMGRMKDAGGRKVSGVILVPDAAEAAWWPLTRHLAFEGLIERGSELEENRLGVWCPTTARRDGFLFSFPRAAGFAVEPVHLAVGVSEWFTGDYSRYTLHAGAEARMRRRVEVGTIVMGRGLGSVDADWVHYIVEEAYPAGASRMMRLSVLSIDYYVKGSSRRTARMSADARVRQHHVYMDADGIYAVGGSLYSVFSRVGRAGREGSATVELQIAAAGALAGDTEAARGELGDGALSSIGSMSPSVLVWSGVQSSGGLSRGSASRPASRVSMSSGRAQTPSSGGLAGGGSPTWLGDAQRRLDADESRHEAVEAEVAEMEQRLGDLVMEDAYELPAGPDVTPRRETDAWGTDADVRAAGYEEFEMVVEGGAAGGEAREGDDTECGTCAPEEAASGITAHEAAAMLTRQQMLEEEASGIEARRCQQNTLVCGGCDENIGFGTMMTMGRRGWLHAQPSCVRADRERRVGEVAAPSRGAENAELGVSSGSPPMKSTEGLVLEARRQRLENTFDAERLEQMRECMKGECPCEVEHDLVCSRACGRGIHSKCAVLGKGAALGKMVCYHCRLVDMQASQPISDAVEVMAVEQTLFELIALKESTARNHLSMERLQQHWLNEVLKEGGAIAKPADNPASLAAMILWLVKSGRGSSLEGFEISFSSYLVGTGRENYFKHESVKKAMKKAKELNPSKPQPKTAATSALAAKVLELIPDEADTAFLEARETFMYGLEAVGGARIGEIAGAQVEHGVYADHMSILRWVGVQSEAVGDGGDEDEGNATRRAPPGVSVGDIFVEHDNETSKTNSSRVMCLVGKTTGPAQIELAKNLEKYWEACGFSILTEIEGGWQVRRPDFSVVQVSLFPLKNRPIILAKLEELLTKTTKIEEVKAVGKSLVAEVKRICRSKDPKDSKLFVNLLGFAAKSEDESEMAKALADELKAIGIRSSVALGPLLMKTAGKKKESGDSTILPMPILSASTYTFMHRVTQRAYAELMREGGDPDLILGKGRDAPRFAHHSWRRLADTVAEAKLARKECTEVDIELHFGWRLAKHSKKMRLHYSNRGARTARARLTEDI